MNPSQFAAKLDATNLKLDATEKDIRTLCAAAKIAQYAAVCVYPSYVSLCADLLQDSGVKVCTVIGFPHGCSSIAVQSLQVQEAAANGASEVDLVMQHAGLRAGEDKRVADQTLKLCETARNADLVSKVIVETCYFSEAEKLAALRICEQAGADFIKTSTGFGSAGSTIDDVRLFKKHRSTSIKIKASGGIRTLDTALALLDAGAERLGVSAANSLLEQVFTQR